MSSKIARRLLRTPRPKHLFKPRVLPSLHPLTEATSLPWTVPKSNFKAIIKSIQERLNRELSCPTSTIWGKVESVGESEYPQSFHCRGGLEIDCHGETEKVMNWVRKELIICGYRDVRVVLCGEGRYGRFSVSVKKPDIKSNRTI